MNDQDNKMTLIDSVRPSAERDVKAATASPLHIHFGTGRLGLGLIAPFFQKPGSALYLLNRAVSGRKETGGTALSSERRNELLRDNPEKYYLIQKPGAPPAEGTVVHYDDFFAYDDNTIEDIVRGIVGDALETEARVAVIVTAAVLKTENYAAVIKALNTIVDMAGQGDAIGSIILVACENTVSAHDVFRHESLSPLLSPEARGRVTCVHALVDRMCVGIEEDNSGAHPTVVVRAEDYGSVKLELNNETEELISLLGDTKIEFSRHVDTEKQIKNWLLNGSHSLIALNAFQEANGDMDLKLNQYLAARPENAAFARNVMNEMRDGVAVILRNDPSYRDFARDVDIDTYLEGAAEAILRRFASTDDPITRILARFQAPTSEAHMTITSFSKRFADRVDEPMRAFEAEHGTVPPATTHSMQSLIRLLASGTFIDLKAE